MLMFRAKLRADGFHTVKYIRLDVTDVTTIQAAKETIDLAEGKLDVLVNNAGTSFRYRTFL
jgi:NADP-dependent 3-hydroxy acid dehydrogenase YdfG